MGVPIGVLFLVLFPATIGLLLFVWGIVGRRVGDRPHCRGCGYELGGIGQNIPQCPECGKDLTAARAVGVGVRRRRPWVAGFGAVLVLMAVAPLVVLAAPAAFRAQPLWMLKQEATSRGRFAGPALSEIASRQRRGQLTTEEVGEVVDLLLKLRASSNPTWTPDAGKILVAALKDGVLTPEQASAFYAGETRITATLPARVRSADSSSVQVFVSDNGSLGGGSDPNFRARVDVLETTVTFRDAAGKVIEVGAVAKGADGKLASVGVNGGLSFGVGVDIDLPVPPGSYQAEITTVCELAAVGLNEPIRIRTTSAAAGITVVEAGAPLWAVVTGEESPEIAVRLQQAIKALPVQLADGKITAGLTELGCPVPVVGELMAEIMDPDGTSRRERVMYVSIVRGPGSQVPNTVSEEGPAPKGVTRGGSIRLLIVPDISRAERMTGIERVWGSEIDLGSRIVE